MWGAGLVLCTKKAKIVQIFDPAPDEVRFYVDRAYCTIHFKTTADAEKAKQKFSGQQPIGSHQTVFLAYLEKGKWSVGQLGKLIRTGACVLLVLTYIIV